MGLLTTAQRAALVAHAPVSQRFTLYLPGSAGGAVTNAVVIDNGTTLSRVTDPGRRDVECYNVSMAKPGRLGIASYTIECDNKDGKLSPYSADTFWDDGGYLADPRECLLKHQVYVLVAGAWSEIEGITYVGRIRELDCDAVAETARITSETMVKNDLEQPWTEEDGETFDTGMDLLV